MKRMFAVSAFLLLLRPLLAQSPWQEAFPGTSLGPARWTAMPFAGTISIANGVLSLTAPDGQASPIVVTNTLPFGMTDWTFEVRARFASTNSRSVPVDLVTVEARAGKSFTGKVAEIRNGITIVVGGSNIYTQAVPDKLFHVIRLEKAGTVVAVRFDDAIVGSKDIGTANPDTIAIGNYGTVAPGTCSAEIDTIAISRANLRGDVVTHYKTGNGSIGGQDASWSVAGPGVTKTNAYIIQPNPYWGTNADALWISPYPTWQAQPKGTFTYSFGFKPPTVNTFRGYGAWLPSDGYGRILMNGGEIAATSLPDAPVPFVAPQSTMTATSTLSAKIDGYGGPTGLDLVFDIHYYPKTSAPTLMTAADLTANCDGASNCRARG